jgi:hypothetical protein
MLERWGHEIFTFIESDTWLRLVFLLALMICVLWVTFRTEKRKPPGDEPSGLRDIERSQ